MRKYLWKRRQSSKKLENALQKRRKSVFNLQWTMGIKDWDVVVQQEQCFPVKEINFYPHLISVSLSSKSLQS